MTTALRLSSQLSLGLTLACYALGSCLPHVDRYLPAIVAVIVGLSVIPVVSDVYCSRRDTTAQKARG
ncbi:hypothetical protein ACIP10_34415 [Streptomyces galbus]|uniref:hypothetical protein n=1 Tax=Streptomyces galbus TaxID=33898 RepID=UPI0037B385CE